MVLRLTMGLLSGRQQLSPAMEAYIETSTHNHSAQSIPGV